MSNLRAGMVNENPKVIITYVIIRKYHTDTGVWEGSEKIASRAEGSGRRFAKQRLVEACCQQMLFGRFFLIRFRGPDCTVSAEHYDFLDLTSEPELALPSTSVSCMNSSPAYLPLQC